MKGKLVKAVLDNRGVKHVWLGNKLGVSKTLVSLWLSEDKKIPHNYRFLIADLLKVPVKELE